MLSEILGYINNYFVCSQHDGTFVISGGTFTSLPDSLKDGQYIRIVGSVFNDGVWLLPAFGLIDETFSGSVFGLAVPRDVISLAADVVKWEAQNTASTFASEAFGSYSYTRASGTDGQPLTWRDAYRQKLNRWRKL